MAAEPTLRRCPFGHMFVPQPASKGGKPHAHCNKDCRNGMRAAKIAYAEECLAGGTATTADLVEALRRRNPRAYGKVFPGGNSATSGGSHG